MARRLITMSSRRQKVRAEGEERGREGPWCHILGMLIIIVSFGAFFFCAAASIIFVTFMSFVITHVELYNMHNNGLLCLAFGLLENIVFCR